jgi:hypothetical protein
MYATRDDMVRQFGETECIALTDREYTGEIDDDVLNGGLCGPPPPLTAIWLVAIRCRGPIPRDSGG